MALVAVIGRDLSVRVQSRPSCSGICSVGHICGGATSVASDCPPGHSRAHTRTHAQAHAHSHHHHLHYHQAISARRDHRCLLRGELDRIRTCATQSILRGRQPSLAIIAHFFTQTTRRCVASTRLMRRRWEALLQLFPTPCQRASGSYAVASGRRARVN